jgi:flavin reductase (DIM6/NTAB) family NADH-FMN oxidoreductase RutF
LILVSLQKTARTHDLVTGSQAFAVTLLSEAQQDISNRFAGRDSENDNRFAGLEILTLKTGSPMLADGLAYFDCRLVSQYDAGTNTVMIGDVVAAQVHRDGDTIPPLVFFNRDYWKLASSGAPL